MTVVLLLGVLPPHPSISGNEFVLPKAAQDLFLNKTFPDSPGNHPLCSHNAHSNVDVSFPILCDLQILHC